MVSYSFFSNPSTDQPTRLPIRNATQIATRQCYGMDLKKEAGNHVSKKKKRRQGLVVWRTAREETYSHPMALYTSLATNSHTSLA